MDMEALSYWLALQSTPGLGARTSKLLLEQFESIDALLGASGQEIERLLNKPAAILGDIKKSENPKETDKVAAWLQAGAQRFVVSYYEERYPRLLREIPDPPVLLYVWGDPASLKFLQLAMVGSRNPTPVGRDNARLFAGALAAAGITITSGLALGVDAACHRGALEAEATTIAVSGTGLDRIYPAQHVDLAEAVAGHGCIVSEFPLGTPPLPENFPQRNRIISGMSLGVIVVEAALRSGSLITARLALEQGREVFAIPGSIHSPQSRGCHKLIQQGAKLVETAGDIVEELGPLTRFVVEQDEAPVSKMLPEADRDSKLLLGQMGYDPIAIDTLVESSGLTTEVISSMLLQMELHGWVERVSGGRYLRKPNS